MRWSKYIRIEPTEKQLAFLLLPHLEAFYGGAGGGGKSIALLAGALQYVDDPGYAALLLRQSYSDLTLPKALIPLSHEWLTDTDAAWNGGDKMWRFPSGAVLAFGYLEHEDDKYRYKGAELQYVGFDELTQFTESQYRYLFSRTRRLVTANVPIRVRSTSNPDGPGFDWVKQRFIVEGHATGRPFIPAKMEDNPFIDLVSYRESLANLDPVTRARIQHGDWNVRPAGRAFKREWFTVVDEVPADLEDEIRYWDLAATEPKPGAEPDWTVGVRLGIKAGIYYVRDVRRTRTTPKGVEDLIAQTAALDGEAVPIAMEQEPGSSGVNTISHYARTVLEGLTFHGRKETGSKIARARPVSAAAEAGNIKIVRGPWVTDFLDEMEAFPGTGHDDQVDALSGAFAEIRREEAKIWGSGSETTISADGTVTRPSWVW